MDLFQGGYDVQLSKDKRCVLKQHAPNHIHWNHFKTKEMCVEAVCIQPYFSLTISRTRRCVKKQCVPDKPNFFLYPQPL